MTFTVSRQEPKILSPQLGLLEFVVEDLHAFREQIISDPVNIRAILSREGEGDMVFLHIRSHSYLVQHPVELYPSTRPCITTQQETSPKTLAISITLSQKRTDS